MTQISPVYNQTHLNSIDMKVHVRRRKPIYRLLSAEYRLDDVLSRISFWVYLAVLKKNIYLLLLFFNCLDNVKVAYTCQLFPLNEN